MIAGPLIQMETLSHYSRAGLVDALLAAIGWVAGGLMVFWAGTGLAVVAAVCFRDSGCPLQPDGDL